MSKWHVERINGKSGRDSDDSDSVISDNGSEESNHQRQFYDDDELNKIMNAFNAEIPEIADNVGVNINQNEIACGSADSGSKTKNSQTTSSKSQPKAAPISQRRRSQRISAMKANADENTKTNTQRTKQSRSKQSKVELAEAENAKKKKNSKSSVEVATIHSDLDRKVVSVLGKRKISDTPDNERAKTILSTAVLKCFTDLQSQIQLQSEPLTYDSGSGPSNSNANSKDIRFSAKCSVCGERKQFQKGSVWNLKSHLEKVSPPDRNLIFIHFLRNLNLTI